ncbi:hypothetical protein ACFLXQ_03890 [Chloroflexota bacterium]
MADKLPKRIYYKAKNDLQKNNLPFFFGWVDLDDEKITGEHYKPKIDRSTQEYLIGYYKIEGDAANFSQTFENHGLIEITQEDFNALLSQWTWGGEYTPQQWGLAWEIAKSD